MRTITLTLFQLLITLTLFAQEEWVIQESPTNMDLYSVDFINANNGIAVGALGTILKTTNGGQTWQSITTNYENLLGVSFYDETHAVAVGVGGQIIVSDDGGTTWTTHQLPENQQKLCSVDITSDGKGVACGDYGIILHTTDGGINWTIIQQEVPGCLNSVRRVNDSVTYVFGTGGNLNRIQKLINDKVADTYSFYINHLSYDWEGTLFDGYAFNDTSVLTVGSLNHYPDVVGAITINQKFENPVWESCFTMDETDFFGVDFIGDHGVAVGGAADFQPEKCIIVESNDGGTMWVKEYETDLANKFYDVKLIENVAYVVGNKGMILKREIETHSASVSLYESQLIVFPNPSSGNNDLKFTLDAAEYVSIMIYNPDGRLINLPFTGYLNAGEHHITNSLTGAKLTPGVYFIKLATGTKVTTAKMIIQ